MSQQIEKALVQQYKNNFELLLQQKGSVLRNSVRVESQKSEFDYYDRIGQTVAQKVTGRHQDTPLVDTPHDRRRCGLVDYDWADLIDKQDKIRLLGDPQSSYTQNAVYAMGRSMDDVILEALFGTAYTGKDGSGTQAFPAGQQIAVNDHTYDSGSGNTGLTKSKLISAKVKLKAAQVDPSEELYAVINAKLLGDLLATTEVTSADYNTVKALVNGDVDSWMGFKFLHCERILTNTSNNLRMPIYSKTGLLLAIGQDVMVDASIRNDKRNATQIYVNMSLGAVRMEEKKVVEVICLP